MPKWGRVAAFISPGLDVGDVVEHPAVAVGILNLVAQAQEVLVAECDDARCGRAHFQAGRDAEYILGEHHNIDAVAGGGGLVHQHAGVQDFGCLAQQAFRFGQFLRLQRLAGPKQQHLSDAGARGFDVQRIARLFQNGARHPGRVAEVVAKGVERTDGDAPHNLEVVPVELPVQ